MVAEREQRADRLAAVGLARQLDRALEVLARLLGVADPAEDAAEDAVRAARGARLVEPLGQAQRLLGRVDREHVVAGVHVERGGLLVEADELEARRAVLEQVDALAGSARSRPGARPCARARRRSCGAGRRPARGPPGARWYSRQSSQTPTAASTRPSRSATSPCFSPIRARPSPASSDVRDLAARPCSGRRPRRSSRGRRRRRRRPRATRSALAWSSARARRRSRPASEPSAAARP